MKEFILLSIGYFSAGLGSKIAYNLLKIQAGGIDAEYGEFPHQV